MEAESGVGAVEAHPGGGAQRAAGGQRRSRKLPQRGGDGGRGGPHVGRQQLGTVRPFGPQQRPQPDSGRSAGPRQCPPADGPGAGAGLRRGAHPGSVGPAGGVGLGQRLSAGPQRLRVPRLETPEGGALCGQVCVTGGLRGLTQPGSGALPGPPGPPPAPRGQMQTVSPDAVHHDGQGGPRHHL